MRKIATTILALSTMCATILVLNTATAAAHDPAPSKVMELAMLSPETDDMPDNYQIFNSFRRYWNVARAIVRAQGPGWASGSRHSGLGNLAFDLANNFFFGYQPNYTFTNSSGAFGPSNVDRIFDQ